MPTLYTSLRARHRHKLVPPEPPLPKAEVFAAPSRLTLLETARRLSAARWMGDPSRPKMPGGHDLLVGQNDAPSENRVRNCAIFGSGFEQANVATNAQWIIPTGGGYFFVPSISALRNVLAA